MLLVDAANVIGSRPDGWWRDRPGAASRLVSQLRESASDGRLEAQIVVVLEGAARAGVAEGESGGVRVVHAERGGDERLVELAGGASQPVVLVSADRELRRRITAAGATAAGATAVGPGWLHRRLGDRHPD